MKTVGAIYVQNTYAALKYKFGKTTQSGFDARDGYRSATDMFLKPPFRVQRKPKFLVKFTLQSHSYSFKLKRFFKCFIQSPNCLFD